MFRKVLALVVVLGLLLPVAGIGAQDAARKTTRGIVIGKIGLESQDLYGANIRWDSRWLKRGKASALSLALVATRGNEGVPVFSRPVTASAGRPTRDYVLSLNQIEQAVVRKAAGLGFVATQKVDFDGGLYDRASIARAGKLPVVPSLRSRCSPVQASGSYSGCYYGYSDLSDMDLSKANFTDAQFPFATLEDTNFNGANLSYAQFSYANMKNANLSNANLTGAYLYGANLMGANLTSATLTNAQYCYTIMPNGTVNNSNC